MGSAWRIGLFAMAAAAMAGQACSGKGSPGGADSVQSVSDSGAPNPGAGASPPADAGTSPTSAGSADGGASLPGASTPADAGSSEACADLMPVFESAVERTFDTGTHRDCSVATSNPAGQIALGVSGAWGGGAGTNFYLYPADGSTEQGPLGLVTPDIRPEVDPWFHWTSVGYQGIVHDPGAGPPAVTLRSWDGDGVQLGSVPFFAITSAPDGAGGTVLLARSSDANPTPLLMWIDAAGHVTRSVPLDASPGIVEVGWATGHVLAIVPAAPSSRARWFDGAGMPLTPWFDVAVGLDPSGGAAVRLLLDGSIALNDGRSWVASFRDGRPGADPPPGWLASRPNTRLASIRLGRAYAVLPLDQPGADATRFEIVTASGEGCGAVPIPPASVVAGVDRTSRRLDVGLDGTLFQQDSLSGPSEGNFGIHCAFRWWPALLR